MILFLTKIPNKRWEFIVYDKLDRVRETGPTKAPFNNLTGQVGWLFTKYDNFNRPIITTWQQASVNANTHIVDIRLI